MEKDLHHLSRAFLAGAIVEDGKLSVADRSWVMGAAQAFARLHIPMSAEFKDVAAGRSLATMNLPYDHASLRTKDGFVDYLKMPQEYRDTLIICNIPADNKLGIEKPFEDWGAAEIDKFLQHRAFANMQRNAGTEESLVVSELHTPQEWARKIGEDQPYVVAIMGGGDGFDAYQIAPPGYIALREGLGANVQGILIDRNYLADLQIPLAAGPMGEVRRMLPLIALSLEAESNPTHASYSWDYNKNRFVFDGRRYDYSQLRP